MSSSKVRDSSPKQSRTFSGILYSDSESYVFSDVLENLRGYFKEFAYVVHDQDLTEEGEPKKLHVHWVGRCKNPAKLTTISNKLGVPENSVEFLHDWEGSIQYLIHQNAPEKFQYPVESVEANFDWKKFLKFDKEQSALKIYDMIVNQNKRSLRELIPETINQKCYGEFVRAQHLWMNLIKECND